MARQADSIERYRQLADKALRTNRSDVYLRAARMGERLGLLTRAQVEALGRLIAMVEG